MKVKVISWGTEVGLEKEVNKALANFARLNIEILEIKFAVSSEGNTDGFENVYSVMILYI